VRIYALTKFGKQLARSTTNPDTNGWKIVHHLDRVGHNSPDQIASYTGMSEGEAGANLGNLRRKGIVAEITQQQGGNF